MPQQYVILDPPSNITYETIGIGNQIKFSWEPILDAYGYAIEKFDRESDGFVLIDVVRNNSYIDYTNIEFSTDIATNVVTYRFATIGGEDEIYSKTSDPFYVNIPKLPIEYSNLEEKDDTFSIAEKITGFKEEKLVLQKDNNANFYKLSMLDPTTNATDLFLSISSYGDLKEIYSGNDDKGFYIQFTNNNIVKFNQNTLFPILTLPTLNKSIDKVQISSEGNLLCCVETLFSEKQITIYDMSNDTVKTNLDPIKLTNSDGSYLNILDYALVNNVIYILDEFGSVHVYSIDFVARTVNFEKLIYNNKDYVNEYNLFYRKAHMTKMVIHNITELYSAYTDEEKELINKIIFSDNTVLNGFVTTLNHQLKDSAVNLNDETIYKGNFETFIDSFVDEMIANELLSSVDLTSFKTLIKGHELFDIHVKSAYASASKFLESVNRYEEDSRVLHSNLHNYMIIYSPFYVKMFDIRGYKMNDIVDCITPKAKIHNYVLEEVYTDSDKGVNDTFDNMLLSEVDRIIKSVEIDPGMRSIAIHFEDLVPQPLYTIDTITYDYAFSNQYVDFYKVDPNDVVGNNLSDVDTYTFDYSFLKGFGYPIVYDYSLNSHLLKDCYYFSSNRSYFCLKNKYNYQRTEPTVADQLSADLADGSIIEITEKLFDVLHFITRINLTSRSETYDSVRYFSMFGDENKSDTVDGSTIDVAYNFLDGKVLYTENACFELDIVLNMDRFGESCLITSFGDEPDNDGRKTSSCLYLGNEFFPFTDIIITPKLILNRQTYTGNFGRKVISCDDKNMFLRAYENQTGEAFVAYYSPLLDSFNLTTNLDNFRKETLPGINSFFSTVSAIYVERSDLDETKPPALGIYNDQKTSETEVNNFYGNQEIVTWRWDIDYNVLVESDYLAFRVSIDNEPWNYLPKNARTFESHLQYGDGNHLFNIQYQYRDGTWSESLFAYYYLKTTPPNAPILLTIENSSIDRGKPVLVWDRSPDHNNYIIEYNDNIEYNTTDNFHTPEESYTNYTDDLINIPIRCKSVDKNGNESDWSTWSFVVSSFTKPNLTVIMDKYTNNYRPLVVWTPQDGETIDRFYYRFDSGGWIESFDLSCHPAENLTVGIHSFEIYGEDSLENKTGNTLVYFEINDQNENIPTMMEETIERTSRNIRDNMYFNFNYHDATQKFIYSFDNFINEFLFDNYTLDLRHSNLELGFNTIYIKSLDRYGNRSETLEYTFEVLDGYLEPITFNYTDRYTSNKRPIWTWINNSDYSYIDGRLTKEDELIELITPTKTNKFYPKVDLGDGDYNLLLTAYDSIGRKSVSTSLTITINTDSPEKPVLLYEDIRGTGATFGFQSGSFKTYGLLNEYSQIDSNNIVYHEGVDNKFTFNYLKPNTNYYFTVYNYGSNSKESQKFLYSFTTGQDRSHSTKNITLSNGVTLEYNLTNGTYKILPLYEYSGNKILLNNKEYEIDHIKVDSNVDSVSYFIDMQNAITLDND